jgi:Holliday junction resolvasome RuvABC ATP-dependent DNA helicase subunit
LVETLAAAVGGEAYTIGDVYEAGLSQERFIARTARSRIARSGRARILTTHAAECLL